MLLQRVRDVPKEAAPGVIVDALEQCVANVPPRTRLPAAPGVVKNLLHWISTTAWTIIVRVHKKFSCRPLCVLGRLLHLLLPLLPLV